VIPAGENNSRENNPPEAQPEAPKIGTLPSTDLDLTDNPLKPLEETEKIKKEEKKSPEAEQKIRPRPWS